MNTKNGLEETKVGLPQCHYFIFLTNMFSVYLQINLFFQIFQVTGVIS